MNQVSKDILLRLLLPHKELGISEQIDYQKSYLDSVISNSVALSNLEPESIAPEMVDKLELQKKMVDKWSIKPFLAVKLVDILEFVADKDEFTTEQIVSHFGFNERLMRLSLERRNFGGANSSLRKVFFERTLREL